MNIFPKALVRIGGISFDKIEQMNSIELKEYNEHIFDLIIRKEKKKETFTRDLLQLIQVTEDHKNQNLLQNFRRDLFNNRVIKESTFKKIEFLLSDDLKQQLTTYLQKKEEVEKILINFDKKYIDICLSHRRCLQTFANNEIFKKGLILSSVSLYNRLTDYTQKDPNSFRKNEFNIEFRVLKYLTRICSKTSPFSTFNNLAWSDIVEGVDGGIDIKSSTETSEGNTLSHIRINNHLLRYLKAILRHYRPFYTNLLVYINPTTQLEGNEYKFLTNHNNVEAFQKVSSNEVLGLILEVMTPSKDGIILEQLISTIADSVEGEIEVVENFITQLIDIGFLEFNWQVSGTDGDWENTFIEKYSKLAEKQIPLFDNLLKVLQDMITIKTEFSTASANDRIEILNRAHSQFKDICFLIHAEANLPAVERMNESEQKEFLREKKNESKAENAINGDPQKEKENVQFIFKHKSSTFFYFKPQDIFFEDTTRSINIRLDKEEVITLAKKLDAALSCCEFFDPYTNEKDQMFHYYKQKYGVDESINILTFYEDYFRDVKQLKPLENELQVKETELATCDDDNHEEKLKENSNSNPEFKKELKRNWMTAVGKLKLKESNLSYVNITLQELTKINQSIGLTPEINKYVSNGAFIQFFYDKSNDKPKLKCVVNATFPGYGKMFSRFLHLADPTVTGSLLDWNKKFTNNGELYIENSDASYFNANIHPNLMPKEVRIPGGHNMLPSQDQCSINEFNIKADTTLNRLYLENGKSKEKSYFFDMGFQAQSGRSPLFQLLNQFTKAQYHTTFSICDALNNHDHTKTPTIGKTVLILPRITFENDIILQRKTWLFPKEFLPKRNSLENDSSYFLRFNQWRNELQIPDEVFITINPFFRTMKIEEKDKINLTRNDSKPQYINHHNPLLIGLFEKLISKNCTMIKIQEMLPNSSQLFNINGEKFVFEKVLQWYKYEQ